MSNIENLHIKELTIDNYKSLKNSKIELKSGLNIIIGKNGAGKSNLLEFINQYAGKNISFLSINSYPRRLPYSNYSVSFSYNVTKQTHEFSYSIERYKTDPSNGDVDFVYAFSFSKKENSQFVFQNKKRNGYGNDRIWLLDIDQKLKTEIQNATFKKNDLIAYTIPNEAFWVSQPRSFTIDNENQIEILAGKSSFSFFEMLDLNLEFTFITAEDLKPFDKGQLVFIEDLLYFIKDYFTETNINEILKEYSPISEIRVNRNINSFLRGDTVIIENLFVEFLIGDDWLPWSYLSDGTKRLFYLITECINLKEGLVLVEEPELGIHPHQLFKLMDFLKEQSRTKQVIITTHSPMVLDILNEDELDRITIAEYDKGTKFLKLDEEQISKAKEYINEVGELSYYWLHSDLEK